MSTQLIPVRKVEELEAKLPELEKLEESYSGYTLAQAIREGSMVTSQLNGGFVSEDGEKMCALSAALLALKARHLA